MQIDTVNVIVLVGGGNFDSIASFIDDEEGNKEAEALFTRLIGLRPGKELEDALDKGIYEIDDAQFIIARNGLSDRFYWKSKK